MREFPRAPASARFRERVEPLCSPVRNEPAALERMGRLMDIFLISTESRQLLISAY
jgi:hypothetical protein